MIQAPTGTWGVMFWTALALLTITLALILVRRWGRNEEWMTRIQEWVKPHKRLAQLNRVVCYHCELGMGVYNPVYRMVDGAPHVEGTCSHCGKHISVRLKG